MREVTLGMIQIEPHLGDVAYNLEHSAVLIRQAAAKGAQIIVLPETYTTGYDLGIYDQQAFYDMAEEPDGACVTMLRSLAKELGVYIAAGMAIKTANPPVMENAIVFIDDQGQSLPTYDKNHLFGDEKRFFYTGSQFPVYDTKYGKVGIICCYDANFPEPARLLTLKGAELILHAATWRREDEDVWHLMLPCRAAENTVFFATANTWGYAPSRYTFGRSKVINPRGIVIAETGMAAEEILVCTIDLDQIYEWRKEMLYLEDINPIQYAEMDALLKARNKK